MPDKPSYLGLLNAVSLAETAAHEYLEAWIKVTPNDDVRGVLQTVSAREGEHGKAFAKRINELGFTLRPKDDPDQAKRMAIASSKKRTDLEKMERFGLGQLDTGDEPDIFDGFFSDHSIDIRTGELLGRYIAEERDSARLLRSCYEQLKAAADGSSAAASADRLAELERKVDELLATMAPRNGRTAKASSKNGRRTTSKS